LYDFDVSEEIPKTDLKSSSYAPENTQFRLRPYLDPVNMRVGIAARW
jgi:hypothetical protein